ncbi:hypothetical protein ACHAO9_001463 [Fusarium lateritium]
MHNIKYLCLTVLVGILLHPIAAQDNPGQRLVTETAVIIFAVPQPTAVDDPSTQSTQNPIPANSHHRLDVVSDTQPVQTQPDSVTSIVNPDPSPSVVIPVVNPDPSPSITNPDPSPSIVNLDPSPSIVNPDLSPSIVNPDLSPSIVNLDPSPSVVIPVVNPDPSPSIVNPIPSPSVVVPVVIPDPSPSVVVPVVDPDPSPSVVVPIVIPDPSPSVVVPVINPDPSPSIANPDPSPSIVDPVVDPEPSPSVAIPEPTVPAQPSATANPSGVPESDKPSEQECSTPPPPPECTKTLSYIELDNTFTSTVFGDCPGLDPVIDCVLREQSTTTTTIVPEVTVASNTNDFSGEVPASANDDFEKDDNGIKDYLEQQFEDAGISHQDELVLEAEVQCKDGDVQIPSSCFERIYPAFCSEQAQNPSQNLVKAYNPSDAKGQTKRTYRPALHERRINTRDDECNDLFIKFAYIAGTNSCDQNCTTVMKIFEGQCILDGGQSSGGVAMSCGTYAIVPAKSTAAPPAPTTSTSETPVQTTVAPKQPLQVNPVYCDLESNYPHHDDIQKSDQANFAKEFCDNPVSLTMGRHVNTNLGKTIGPEDQLDHVFYDNYGVAYHYAIWWNSGCTTDVDRQSIQKPIL